MSRRRSSPWALLTAVVVVAVLGAGGYAALSRDGGSGTGGGGSASQPGSPSAPAAPGAPASTGPDPAAATRDAAVPTPADARALLAGLAVKGRAPATGYDRVARFGEAWTDVDRNGCDTRDDVLARDLVDTTTRSDCWVLTGTLHDPYTGRTIAFQRGVQTSAAVQIDHVVALMDAWQTGAQSLSQDQRVHLANDPLNLVAVDGPTNQAKGAGDAATWLPPNTGYRCAYASRQVAVKTKYMLWVTPAEKDALARLLSRC
ncbi:HNH endonuclease family protein [Leifsonia sp. NPDC080035]|uniref:HNH endonuclease family protein n=1 Tax=Leifsonia sp. NPDC080035 TaxID=3143936 RepID=A0AAU7GFP6_9MICO